MLAEIIPKAYDYEGKPIDESNVNKYGFSIPIYRMESFINCRMFTRFKNMEQLRHFLMSCDYVVLGRKGIMI